jgi:hypothetical protein
MRSQTTAAHSPAVGRADHKRHFLSVQVNQVLAQINSAPFQVQPLAFAHSGMQRQGDKIHQTRRPRFCNFSCDSTAKPGKYTMIQLSINGLENI